MLFSKATRGRTPAQALAFVESSWLICAEKFPQSWAVPVSLKNGGDSGEERVTFSLDGAKEGFAEQGRYLLFTGRYYSSN